eukprot:gene27587-36300_t
MKSTGPRVEFIDGKMVIKESSLEVGNDNNYNEDIAGFEEIEESANQSNVTYSSFMNKSAPLRWGIEETHLFYQALSQCGTNFSLMQTFFPNRTRGALKRKFTREEKAKPDLVKLAISTGIPL